PRHDADAGVVGDDVEDAGGDDYAEADIGEGVGELGVEQRAEHDGPEDLAVLGRRDLARRYPSRGGDEQDLAGAAEAADDGEQRQLLEARHDEDRQHQQQVQAEDIGGGDADQADTGLGRGDHPQHRGGHG